MGVCLSGTPKGGDEAFECSANRALYGMKVVTVLIIPIVSCIFLLAAFIIMFKQVKGVSPKPKLALLCLAQTILSILCFFTVMEICAVLGIRCSHRLSHDESERQQVGLDYHHRATGLQSASDDWCLWHKWYLRSFGPPSADNVKSYEVGQIDAAMAAQAGCSAYYGNFFNVEAVE